MGWYAEASIKAPLCIPAGIGVVGAAPLGYPDQEPRQRKELDEIAYYND